MNTQSRSIHPTGVRYDFLFSYKYDKLFIPDLSTILLRMPSINFMTAGDPLSLDRIRSVLTRLEDTIIFSLIERAQFGHNPRIYQRGAFRELADLGFHGSWLEWFLKETESFHGESLMLSSQPNKRLMAI